jgi:Cd2+/Zn2+-exporting ATPase
VLDSPAVSADDVVRAVAQTGMRAETWQEKSMGRERESTWDQHSRTVTTVVSGLLAAGGFVVHAVVAGGVAAALGGDDGIDHGAPLFARVLYGIGVLSGVWFVAPRAWYAVRTLRPDMNLLMTIAVGGAIVIGEWFEAATVAFLFALSLALESWSIGRARRAVASLLELAPSTVRLVERGGTHEVPADEASVGSRFLVKPGERVALDGDVRTGHSLVDEAPITGESLPVTKAPGTSVFAGSINGDGALEVVSTKPAEDTVLANIIRLVRQTHSRRAPSEQWVAQFAHVYTPAVFGLAILVWLVPPVLLGGAWDTWAYRALVLLVIGCPCALVISTPVSIVASLTAAARQGVLIKGGVFVEAPAHLAAIAFDKTGTLTEGNPAVVQVVTENGHTEEQLLATAAAMETHSTHPLARAIVAHAKDRGIPPASVQDFRILPGKGATATVEGREFWVGSHRYLEERGQETAPIHAALEALSDGGRTVVVIGNDDHVCGFIALADPVRPAARRVLDELRGAGIERVVMLTGDNAATAESIGRDTGVDEVQAELLPADKVAAIEALLARYGAVAMVGDGVNDAPAMARATLGIAMGAVGSDAAIETADIALMADDLTKLPWLVRHSRRTLRIIRQNIAFSLGVKAVFVALTFAGFASLWAAIAADMGASLLVVVNGLRLLKGRE